MPNLNEGEQLVRRGYSELARGRPAEVGTPGPGRLGGIRARPLCAAVYASLTQGELTRHGLRTKHHAVTRVSRATVIVLFCSMLAGCTTGSTTKVTKVGGIDTTVVNDSQWLIVLLTASTALVSSLLTAWLSSYFSARSEREKRAHEGNAARETRVRQQIGEVAQQVSAMMLEMVTAFRMYAEGTNTQAVQAMEAAERIARKHGLESLGKVQVLEDATLRTRATDVFSEYERVTSAIAASLTNGTPEPDVDRLQGARDAFFERARAVIATL